MVSNLALAWNRMITSIQISKKILLKVYSIIIITIFVVITFAQHYQTEIIMKYYESFNLYVYTCVSKCRYVHHVCTVPMQMRRRY